MVKTPQSFELGNNWYYQPEHCVARITTEQWKQMLLQERDTFMAVGCLWQLKATRVGPGVYEIKAKRKKL